MHHIQDLLSKEDTIAKLLASYQLRSLKLFICLSFVLVIMPAQMKIIRSIMVYLITFLIIAYCLMGVALLIVKIKFWYQQYKGSKDVKEKEDHI